MSKSLINLGTNPNDRTGDTLRDAGSKVNSNVNELYTALGDGINLKVDITGATSGQTLKFNGSTFVPAADENTNAVTSVNGEVGVVVLDTDLVNEGTTNLYYTDARTRAAISVDTNDTQLSYTDGVIGFTQGNTDTVSEGTNNLYYTAGRFDFTLSQKTTDNLTEGVTNLYYTDTRSRAAISAAGTVTYDDITGVITGPTLSTVATTGAYSDLAGVPALFSGSYNDLSNVPTAFTADKIAPTTAPTSATDTGTAGEIRYDSGFVYVCVATDTWVRAALSTWA